MQVLLFVLCRVIRTKQFGLENGWHRRDLPARPGCDFTNSYEPVYLSSVMMALYAFVLGLLASIFILIIERSVHYLLSREIVEDRVSLNTVELEVTFDGTKSHWDAQN